MSFRSYRTILASAILGLIAAACTDDSTPTASGGSSTQREYGAPTALGNGRVRTYVLVNKGVPVEVGVALDSAALEGLRAPMDMPSDPAGGDHNHVDTDAYALAMPAQNPTPYKFVELDWNPAGHEPAGIYTLPHFDFHFYKIDVADRDAILPTDPQFAVKSANVPAPEYMPAFAFSPPPLLAVP
jgi:hypothetical protein